MVNITSVLVDTNAGRLAAAAVTNTFATLLSASGSVRKLIITNSLNQECSISLDNGVTVFVYLPPSVGLVLDFDNSVHFSGIIQVKYEAVAPTSGFICAGILKGH